MAIDMGGSKFMVGFVDSTGQILCSQKYLWTKLDKDGIISDVIQALYVLMSEHPEYSPVTVGATIPGLADPQKGLWVEASFSGIRNLPVTEILTREFKIPAFADNDSRACALAEKIFGVCKNNTDFLWMTVSNGIGGALYLNDMLYMGGFGNAGEIGHLVVCEDNGRKCKCGSIGCLEVHAAGPAVVKNYLSLGGVQQAAAPDLNAKTIEGLARKGDKAALATYKLEGYYLGKAIAVAANITNPQKVVLGGGVSMAFDLFEEEMKNTVLKMVYNFANSGLIIERTGLGYEAALLGAAALAFRGVRLL